MNIKIDEGIHERRSWEPWSPEEIKVFFDSIVKYGRNWALIAKEIGTKRQEQVRTYFYRLLKKVTKLLEPLRFSFDSRDRMDTLIALLCYWEAKRDLNIPEAPNPTATANLARAVRDRILKQRKELEVMRARRLPLPEKVTFQLVPMSEDMSADLTQAGCNPKLQLTVKSSKRVSSIIQHLMNKWTRPGNEGKRIQVATGPIRLYPHGKSNHPGWGVEDEEITALKVFHTLNCPEVCKIDYNWKSAPIQPQPQQLGSDLSAADLEQFYQLYNATESEVVAKNERSNSDENSYTPENHYFNFEDFQHSDEDNYDTVIKLSSSDAFGFESNESHSYSVEEQQGILSDINTLLNTSEHEQKVHANPNNAHNMSPVSINNNSINNMNIQHEREHIHSQRSLLNGSGTFSVLHDVSSMGGFDTSNDMFANMKHATSSFSTSVNNNFKKEKIKSENNQLMPPASNNGNGQGYPSPKASGASGVKRRLQPESLFKEDSLDVNEAPSRQSDGSRNNISGNKVRLNENGKRDLDSFIEDASFVPFRSHMFNGQTDNNSGVAAKRQKLDSVP